jgi:putative nucleotidyltransferase with HDIG domain
MAAFGELLHPGLKEIGLDEEQSPFVQVVNEGVPLIMGGEKSDKTPFKVWENPYDGRSLAIVPFTRRGEVYGVMSIAGEEKGKKFDEDNLFLLHLLSDRANLSAENIFLYERLSISLRSILRALVRSLEAKDPYTKEHSERVANLAIRLASSFGFEAEVLDSLSFAAHLHDIGKIGISDQILMKPRKLNPDELDIIKLHPIIGEEIVSHLDVEPIVRSCIRNHHERWDGKGYPDGLSGDEIPFLVRILSLADCYDALTSKRPYRDMFSVEDAVKEIKKVSGSHFDPKVVEAFEENIYENRK